MTDPSFHLTRRDYDVFNLRKNPFPYSGVPESNPSFYIGQEEVLSAILQTISTTILTEKSSHIILTGPYGCGKSHTLQYIKEQLKNYGFDDGTKPVVGYISQPGDKMLDLYREFMYDLGMETVQTYARQFLCDVSTDLISSGKIESEIVLPVKWEHIQRGDLLLSDIVPTALIRLNDCAKYVDYCKAFINLVYDENSLSAWEWVSGEGLDYVKRKILCISKNIDAKSVVRAFQAIKEILTTMKHNPIILMIDEFEAIENFQPGTKQNLLNSLRHLIDINGTNLSIIIACAPDVWQSLISEYHAFSERICKEACIKPLSAEKTKELIQAYLIREVIDNKSLYDPFSEDVYPVLFKIGMGNSRQILTLCGKLIDYAIDNHMKLINPECIQEFCQ